MINKSERTPELYKDAGAWARLCKEVVHQTYLKMSCILYAKDSDKFMGVIETLGILSAMAEDKMFDDHPNASNEHLSVFFGSLDTSDGSQVDEEIVKLAKEHADSLFTKHKRKLIRVGNKSMEVVDGNDD